MKTLTLLFFVIASLYSHQVSAKGRTPLSLCSPTSEAAEFAATSIRNHLVSFPESADTLEGIHLWWIDWPEPKPAVSCTLVALERLRAEGVVEELKLSESSVWRRARN